MNKNNTDKLVSTAAATNQTRAGNACVINNLYRSIAQLSPAYFGLVMATGIVALASLQMGFAKFAQILFYLNIVQYAVLAGLYIIRACAYPKLFFTDLVDHMSAPGFFTVVAGTGILSSQIIIQADSFYFAHIFWMVLLALWLLLTYVIFTAFTVKLVKPSLAQGISGGWLLAVVATQSVAVTSALLASNYDNTYNLELNFLALSMWLWGGMLYILIMSLIFYRYVFFQFSSADLTPPYWINMGAMAISTLAGSLLINNIDNSPFLGALAPFIKGFTIFYWAAGTWWIPMLFLLGFWRYILQRFPFRYDPLYWGAVFPFGMYAACTWQLEQIIEIHFLSLVSKVFLYLAIFAWTLTFVGMLYSLIQHAKNPVNKLSG